MVNEATKIELTNETGFVRRYTVASGVAIAKGAILNLTDDNTAALSGTSGEPVAGIASMQKSATDFSTSIAAWTDGVFKVLASGGITVGNPLSSAGHENYVKEAASGLGVASGARVMGYAMETVTDDQTFRMRLRT